MSTYAIRSVNAQPPPPPVGRRHQRHHGPCGRRHRDPLVMAVREADAGHFSRAPKTTSRTDASSLLRLLKNKFVPEPGFIDQSRPKHMAVRDRCLFGVGNEPHSVRAGEHWLSGRKRPTNSSSGSIGVRRTRTSGGVRQWQAGLRLVAQLYRPNHVEAWLST